MSSKQEELSVSIRTHIFILFTFTFPALPFTIFVFVFLNIVQMRDLAAAWDKIYLPYDEVVGKDNEMTSHYTVFFAFLQ